MSFLRSPDVLSLRKKCLEKTPKPSEVNYDNPHELDISKKDPT